MRRIALFARPPEAGRVKTRLAPALTPALALALYRAMLADALEVATTAADERYLWWASPFEGELDRTLREELDRGGWRERVQLGSDLGERLGRAFAELSGPDTRTVIIGADCPELAVTVLGAAFHELERSELVLGPTGDGGYYLIGLRRPAPDLFRGIAWSTGQVLAQTLERAERAGLSATLLGKLDDIDRPEDVARCAARELARRGHEPDPARRLAGARAPLLPREVEPGQGPEGSPGSSRLGAHTRSALRAFGLLP